MKFSKKENFKILSSAPLIEYGTALETRKSLGIYLYPYSQRILKEHIAPFLVWFGLVLFWFGLVWFGLVWFGLVFVCLFVCVCLFVVVVVFFWGVFIL